MNTKNDIDVEINGKKYTLSGYESSEYLQKLANYINDKCVELNLQDGYSRLDMEMKNVFLSINLADDYFKSQKAANDLKSENEEMEKEIFDIKHEMITMQTQLDECKKEIKKLSAEKRQSENDIIRLETELGSKKA